MKQIIKFGTIAGIAAMAMSSALVGVASADLSSQTLTVLISNQADFLGKITTILNWVFTIFIILSILFILLAAFEFITAGGDDKKISDARTKLIWAAVGIIVALISRGLPSVIASIVGVTLQ